MKQIVRHLCSLPTQTWFIPVLLLALPALPSSLLAQDNATPIELEVEAAAAVASTENIAIVPEQNTEIIVINETEHALTTLYSVVKLKKDILADINDINRQLKKAQSEPEKEALRLELVRLQNNLKTTEQNLENIAAGVDLSALTGQAEEAFDLQQELFALLKPAIDEMKDMTSHVRQKSDLREKIDFYSQRLPVIEQALTHIANLKEETDDKALKRSLSTIEEEWLQKKAFMQSQLQAATFQLNKLVAAETSLSEASQSYLKSFFKKRGRYLTEALLVAAIVLLLSRLSYKAMVRVIPGFRRKHRSFRIRVIELIHRMVTVLFTILGPMAVFYYREDWVLFSLAILLLLGITLTLRQALPRYWSQIQLFLNIGSVREGERISMDGLPWMVEQINVYSTLVNPTANLTQRVPIDDLVEKKSRPCSPDEPWFPCKKDDWVILSDGMRGKVTGISPEMVQLVARGGAQSTYLVSDFLANSPRNLATNFRIKETIGISYGLQRESTGRIPRILQDYISNQIEQEGLQEELLNLRVEFESAGDSSLNLVVIADFVGEQGPFYNRLRRAIQRWSVDACSENNWEIPFPQMTLHGAVTTT